MAYSFDNEKYKQIFDNMFGKDSYQKGVSYAGEVGNQIGQLKIKKQQMDEQQRMLEAAQKDAAKKERERQKQLAKEKATGRTDTTVSKQNENLKTRIEASGGSTAKTQSAIGKALHLNPDNNAFQDFLDLAFRPMNAINAVRTPWASENKESLDLLKAGKINDAQFSQQLQDHKPSLSTVGGELWQGLSGKSKLTGADSLVAGGGKKGLETALVGSLLDMQGDPSQLVLNPLVKGAVKTIGAGAKLINKLPVVNSASKAVGNGLADAFSRKASLARDLSGNQTGNNLFNDLQNIENARSFHIDKVKNDAAGAMNIAGKDRGTTVAKQMETTLVHPQPLNITTAPNVLNPQAALDLMNPAMKASTDMMKPLSHVGEVTTKAVETPLSNGLIPNTQQKLDWGSKGFLDTSVDLGSAGRYKTASNGAVDLGAYGNWNVPKIEAEASRYITSGGDIQKAAEVLRYSPKIKQAAQRLIDSNDQIRAFADANGVSIPDMESYMAHFVTEEAAKALKKNGEVISNGIGNPGGNEKSITRTINDSVKNANIKLKNQKDVNFDYFTSDAYTATAAGQQKFSNYIARESAVNKVITTPGISRVLESGQKARLGNVERTINGKRYEITRGANTELDRYAKLTNDVTVNRVLKAYDYVLAKFKNTALFTVGNHARNLAGNNINMYLAGMEPSELAAYQAKSLATVEGAKAGQVAGVAPTKKVDKLYEEFSKQGLKESGSSADITTDAGKNVMSDVRYRTKSFTAINPKNNKIAHDLLDPILHEQGAFNKVKGVIKAPFEASRRLASGSDEMSRFAMYMWARDKGMSVAKATDKVKEAMFDYNDLTHFEKSTMKRLMPFYTWMRKNAEFQLKSLANTPDRYNKINAIYNNAASQYDHPTDLLPGYMKDNMTLPIPGTDKLLALNPPMATLNQLTDPAKMFTDSLTPFLKIPAEIAFNKKSINDAPISKFGTEDGTLLGKKFQGVPLLPDGQRTLGMNGKQWEYLIKGIFSPARNLSGAQDKIGAGATPAEVLATATGGNITPKWDQKGFQQQADYKEKTRLEAIKQEMQVDQGKKVQTIKDLNKQGVYTDPDQAKIADVLTKTGYKPQEIDMLMSLRNKVYNGNQKTAAKTAQTLLQMGIPSDVVQLLTKDYLKY